jgi:2-oxoglutarate ferredoxin oxidoreductase subunit beta
VDNPVSPICYALGAEASFVARSVDVDIKHLTYVLERAAHHKGTAFVEVYQDCNVFNHEAFLYASDKNIKPDNVIYLEHGKPLLYGKDRKKGIRRNDAMEVEKVELGKGISEDDLIFHDEKTPSPALAFLLSRMKYPEMPEPMGVFRAVDRPIYDAGVNDQIDAAIAKQGEGDFDALFNSGDTWVVE